MKMTTSSRRIGTAASSSKPDLFIQTMSKTKTAKNTPRYSHA
jgi:hypothetical protein